ncbi:MAG TPA: CpsD/CapB family tyrosine-protein kinase [Blastocatellia bacterium]|nr:CpsD/CapB family tyrosine-protein kinase [Blastocatellia bacterium]
MARVFEAMQKLSQAGAAGPQPADFLQYYNFTNDHGSTCAEEIQPPTPVETFGSGENFVSEFSPSDGVEDGRVLDLDLDYDYTAAPTQVTVDSVVVDEDPLRLVGDDAWTRSQQAEEQWKSPAPPAERPSAEVPETIEARAVPEGLKPETALVPAQLPSLVVSTLPEGVREEFRRLRSTLLLAAESQQLQVLLVCGIESGDGASFVARNLSLLLAEFDKINVARFELSGLVAEGREPASPAAESFKLTLRRTALPNLRDISTSQGTVTLGELLRTCDVRAMIGLLKSRFDFVLIDAPAVTASADTALLASQVDGVILVAQQDETKCNSLAAARAELQNARANVLGVVLNKKRK